MVKRHNTLLLGFISTIWFFDFFSHNFRSFFGFFFLSFFLCIAGFRKLEILDIIKSRRKCVPPENEKYMYFPSFYWRFERKIFSRSKVRSFYILWKKKKKLNFVNFCVGQKCEPSYGTTYRTTYGSTYGTTYGTTDGAKHMEPHMVPRMEPRMSGEKKNAGEKMRENTRRKKRWNPMENENDVKFSIFFWIFKTHRQDICSCFYAFRMHFSLPLRSF